MLRQLVHCVLHGRSLQVHFESELDFPRALIAAAREQNIILSNATVYLLQDGLEVRLNQLRDVLNKDAILFAYDRQLLDGGQPVTWDLAVPALSPDTRAAMQSSTVPVDVALQAVVDECSSSLARARNITLQLLEDLKLTYYGLQAAFTNVKRFQTQVKTDLERIQGTLPAQAAHLETLLNRLERYDKVLADVKVYPQYLGLGPMAPTDPTPDGPAAVSLQHALALKGTDLQGLRQRILATGRTALQTMQTTLDDYTQRVLQAAKPVQEEVNPDFRTFGDQLSEHRKRIKDAFEKLAAEQNEAFNRFRNCTVPAHDDLVAAYQRQLHITALCNETLDLQKHTCAYALDALHKIIKRQDTMTQFCREQRNLTFLPLARQVREVSESAARLVRLPANTFLLMAEMHRRATFRNSYTEAMEQAQAQLNRMREHELAQRKEFHDRYIRLMEHWPAARLLTDHPRTVRLVTQSFDEQLPVMDVEWLEEVREQLREVLEQHEYTTPYPDLQQGQRLLHPRVSGTDTPPSTARPTNGPSEVFSSSVPEASVQDEGLVSDLRAQISALQKEVLALHLECHLHKSGKSLYSTSSHPASQCDPARQLSPIAEADSSPHSPSPAYSRDDRSPPSTDADTVAQLHQAQSQVASLQAQLEVLQEKYEDSRRLAEAAQDELTRSVLQYSIAPAAMSSDNLPETAMQQGPNKLAQNDEENATSDVDAAGQDEASLALRSNKASKSTLQPEATDADATSREIEVSVPVFASARSDSLDLAVADDGDGDGDEDHLSDDDDASDAVAVSSVASASGEERHPVVEASAASASSAPGHAAEQKDLAPVSAALSPSYQRVKLAIYDFEVGDTVLFMAQNHSIEYMKAFRRSKDDGSEPIECILTQRQMVVHGALRQTKDTKEKKLVHPFLVTRLKCLSRPKQSDGSDKCYGLPKGRWFVKAKETTIHIPGIINQSKK